VAGGARRGVGKPAALYQLTPQAQRLFPKAYADLLGHVLDVLQEQIPQDALDAFMREVGQRLAGEETPPAAGLRPRVETAAGVLNKLGGLVEIEESDAAYRLCGYSCPFDDVVSPHPEVCRAVQAMLTALIAQPVTERCPRSDSLCCWFEIPRSATRSDPA
jgi:predicted ArsR family transcriptional regulator